MIVDDICEYCYDPENQSMAIYDNETDERLYYGNAKEARRSRFVRCGVESLEAKGSWLMLYIDRENEY